MANRSVVRHDRACARCGTSPIRGYKYCHGCAALRPSARAWRRRNGVRSWVAYRRAMRRQTAARRRQKRVPCPTCDKPFVPAERAQRFCSTRCVHVMRARVARLRRLVERMERALERHRRCAHCGRKFFAAGGHHRYCSKACRLRAAAPAKVVRICRECRKTFLPAYGDKRSQFCGSRCALRFAGRFHKIRRRSRQRETGTERFSPVEIFERDGWRCQLCSRPTPCRLRGTHDPQAPELDHIEPLSLGGPHTRANVQTSCRACNVEKGARCRGQLRLF